MTASEEASAPTLAEALRKGAARLKKSETAQLDARVLLKNIVRLDEAGLIARARERLTEEQRSRFEDALARRARGEPVAYITGRKEFWGLEFAVSPATLIPRPDSECLIEAAIARRSADGVRAILDLGVGSGCLLCASLVEFPQALGVGVDQSPAAVVQARENARRLGFASRAAFAVSDWATAFHGAFDIIIANAPYIRENDAQGLAPEIRDHEPPDALFAGPDGLDAYRALLPDISRLAAPGGLVIFECGTDQAHALGEMVSKSFPNYERAVIKDLSARPRGVLADCRLPPAKKD